MTIDIIIIIIILISTLIGYFRGLANTIIALISIVISIILSYFLCTPFTNFLYDNTGLDEAVKAKVIELMPMHDKDFEINADTNEIPDIIQNTVDDKIESTENDINDKKNKIIDDTANNVTYKIMNGISFVILLLGIRIILLVLKIFTAIIKKIPLVNKLDKFGGFAVGLIRGVLIIYIALGILRVNENLDATEDIRKQINNSYIAHYFYDNNLLANKIDSKTDK